MKERFLEAMKHLYPSGVNDSQLLDLIRIFAMGWVESQFDARDFLALPPMTGSLLLQHGMHACSETHALDWRPDDSWKWWD